MSGNNPGSFIDAYEDPVRDYMLVVNEIVNLCPVPDGTGCCPFT